MVSIGAKWDRGNVISVSTYKINYDNTGYELHCNSCKLVLYILVLFTLYFMHQEKYLDLSVVNCYAESAKLLSQQSLY